MKNLHMLFAAAALLVVAAGVGYAAVPAADGTISACRDNKGVLKVIDAEAGQSCSSAQQLLTWNQQGPQGPAGPQGPDGVLATGFESGIGNNPTSSTAFLSPTTQLTFAAGQRVHVVAGKALGSTASGGGKDLDLGICFRSTIIGAPLHKVGAGESGLATPPNTRQLYTLSADFAPGVGTFNVGLCGSTTSGGWNSNGAGYATAILHD